MIKFKKNNEPILCQNQCNDSNNNKDFEIKSLKKTMKKYEDSAILYEDKAKRSINSKVFQLNNGTAKEVFSSVALHYYDKKENRLRTIDNSLLEKNDKFENQYGMYKTEIIKNDTTGKTIKFSKGDLGLEWFYLPKTQPFTLTKNILSPIVNNKLSLSPSSDIKYENIEPNVDLEYSFLGNNIKENIIVLSVLAIFESRGDGGIDHKKIIVDNGFFV